MLSPHDGRRVIPDFQLSHQYQRLANPAPYGPQLIELMKMHADLTGREERLAQQKDAEMRKQRSDALERPPPPAADVVSIVVDPEHAAVGMECIKSLVTSSFRERPPGGGPGAGVLAVKREHLSQAMANLKSNLPEGTFRVRG